MTDTSTATTPDIAPIQVYRVYIKATPEAIWTALTDPEWTNKYGYTGYAHYDLRPGGALKVVPNDEFKAAAEAGGWPCPDVLIEGEVIEADPPRKLVTTWRMLMDPTMAQDPHTKITYEIEEFPSCCSLTVTHDVTNSPATGAMISGVNGDPGAGGGGHPWILSDLKSLLETGKIMADA